MWCLRKKSTRWETRYLCWWPRNRLNNRCSLDDYLLCIIPTGVSKRSLGWGVVGLQDRILWGKLRHTAMCFPLSIAPLSISLNRFQVQTSQMSDITQEDPIPRPCNLWWANRARSDGSIHRPVQLLSTTHSTHQRLRSTSLDRFQNTLNRQLVRVNRLVQYAQKRTVREDESAPYWAKQALHSRNSRQHECLGCSAEPDGERWGTINCLLQHGTCLGTA